ncbi:alpha/beta hydrolase fold domain-containing protein [Sarocladium implicatum]|nr:alpha/beta hydrolase fold domain-containing protein [Sarocladium implicatum]
MIVSILREAKSWFRPLLVALFNPSISWSLRWRLLLLQPTVFLTYSIAKVPYIFSRPFKVEWLPVGPDGTPARALIFTHTQSKPAGQRKLRPLHVDIHGGGFIGGLPENFADFDNRIARETGAVVVSITYRYAPEHTFPAAIDDVDRTLAWLRENAESRWAADPTLMTIGGSSAGGNLALAATQHPDCHGDSPTALRACATFYAVTDQRISPWEKPRTPKMPKSDPTAVLMPLFDAYPAAARKEHMHDPRLSPIVAKPETMPGRMIMVVPVVDILFSEQMEFIERMKKKEVVENAASRNDDWLQVIIEDDGFHGYLEVPDIFVSPQIKARAFDPAITMLREVYEQHGWSWT